VLASRVIPCLLLKGEGLVKTVNFKRPTYVGDPINTIKIFNEKEVDELVILDISATPNKNPPNLKKIQEIASECFMPIGYGGGIRSFDHMSAIFNLGVEKVILNSLAHSHPQLVTEAANRYGSQSVVVSVDVGRDWLGRKCVFSECGSRNTKLDAVKYARQVESIGAGEILLTSIEREGAFAGYDLDLIRQVSDAVSIPVVANGGARSMADLRLAIKEGGASAAAAGSLFVFQGKHRAVLVNYPSRLELDQILGPQCVDSAAIGANDS
jgi:cyclase